MARKVLLADDSVTAQNMGRRILVDAGYEVITVNNGSSALKKASESKPDLIVLDVYMPGYSGLEVCQRIRESPETARIPVLLTVGKLEPFKAGEAQRVRADAFIVKPFEASELLTALTKLEDKIVPQPGSRKAGRSGKSFADEEPGVSKEFGDLDSGWKNRLKIPPLHHPRVQETAEDSDSGLAIARPSDGLESLQEQPQAVSESLQETRPAESAEMIASADQRGQAEEESSQFAIRAEESADGVAAAEIKDEESATAVVDAPIEVQPTPIQNGEAIKAWPETVLNGQQESHEEEVAAALASLAPSKENASEVTASEPVPATIAAAGGSPESSGPRWTAQEIALTSQESSLILEQEMHKSFAAFAAADAARMSVSSSPEKSDTETSAPQITELVASATSDCMESTAGEPASLGTASEKREWESPLPVNAVEPSATPESTVGATSETAAFAAAASAGSGAEAAKTSTEAVSSSAVAPEVPTPGEYAVDADLAAAWASWKQVRESLSGSEFASKIGDSAPTGFTEIRREEPASEPESETAAAAEADDNGAIASIVDSVLAELKPKLMQEIAKKMKKEK